MRVDGPGLTGGGRPDDLERSGYGDDRRTTARGSGQCAPSSAGPHRPTVAPPVPSEAGAIAVIGRGGEGHAPCPASSRRSPGRWREQRARTPPLPQGEPASRPGTRDTAFRALCDDTVLFRAKVGIIKSKGLDQLQARALEELCAPLDGRDAAPPPAAGRARPLRPGAGAAMRAYGWRGARAPRAPPLAWRARSHLRCDRSVLALTGGVGVRPYGADDAPTAGTAGSGAGAAERHGEDVDAQRAPQPRASLAVVIFRRLNCCTPWSAPGCVRGRGCAEQHRRNR